MLTRLTVAALSAGLLMPPPAEASLITFDNLTVTAAVPNGYAGLDWANFWTVNTSGFPYFGFGAGTVSPPEVAFNGEGAPAAISSPNGQFALLSAYFTAAWLNGMTVDVTGFRGAVEVDTVNLTLSLTAPIHETFDWYGLTEVTFSASGGTPNPMVGTTSDVFVMDNLSVAMPEPGSTLLLTAGLSGLAFIRRRKAA